MKSINVTQSSMPAYEEYCKEIRQLWDTKWLTNMGEKHKEFQKKLEEYLDVPHVDLTTNGHMALELALVALGLTGEVITTPFTFSSTTHAIVRAGLRPVFCDINRETFTIDVDKIESLITPATCAIMPVHVYGNVCDVFGIDSIAKKYGLKVVYDAAHSFGIKYKNRGIASYGDVSCFSFHATKVFHTIEGGAVCFKDPNFGKRFFEIKDFGIHNEECVRYVGPNAKFNEFCAAMGKCNLRYIDREIEKRRVIVDRYRSNLSGVSGLHLNIIQPDVVSNYSYFPIIIEPKVFGVDRDYVKRELEKKGIKARKYFYPLINEYDCYKNDYSLKETPIAFEVSRKVLTLPLYAELDLNDVDYICKTLLSCSG